jgi:uncharacterized membrane protein YhaH (DUF805 family)
MIMSFSESLFRFEGRIARLPFFLYSLFVLVIGCALLVGGGLHIFRESYGFGALVIVCGAVWLSWTSIALTIKRLHDLGHTGQHLIWIALLGGLSEALIDISPGLSVLVSMVSVAVSLYLLFVPGNKTDNIYGPATI